ncbi:Serine/threonine protein kinase, partial [Parasponia andersonii]
VITSFNGVCNPLRTYSVEELNKVTSRFHWRIHEGWTYIMYKGVHEDREISVKKFRADLHEDYIERIVNEVTIASRMSNHNNVLKLLGYCLETESPILVYEFPTKGNLASYIYGDNTQLLSWDRKLRIVTGIANAVAYLHQGLPKIFIHRDIKPTNTYLDQNEAAKLFDFQGAIPIPEGETYVHSKVYRTYGYHAPEAVSMWRYTEKSDVYSFGVLLFEVLSGKRFRDFLSSHNWELSYEISSNSEDRLEDFWVEILEKYCEINYSQEKSRAQVREYVQLVQICVKDNPDERPNMLQVEKALGLIRSIQY